MHIVVAGCVALVLLLPDAVRADVRVDEHAFTPLLHDAEHVAIPDLIAACLPPRAVPGRFLIPPTDGRVSSLFGWRRDPILGTRRFHAGIDFANLRSSRVVAAADGRVRRAGAAAGCGLAVVIDHGGGLKTRSCHLDRLLVRAGDRVAAGETIGLMGATGRATGSHLHFELIDDGRPADPAPLLAFASDSR